MNVLRKLSVSLVFVVAFCATFSAAVAADSEHHKQVNDVDFYLAVIPAEITQGNPDVQARYKKHETHYHIIVSLFDSRTGNRINDAEVQATVSTVDGMGGKNKKLEPMLIMDTSSYGNYFLISDPGKYRLRFKAMTPARKYELVAEFFFDRPMD